MTTESPSQSVAGHRPLIFQEVSFCCSIKITDEIPEYSEQNFSKMVDVHWQAATTEGRKTLFDGQLYSVRNIDPDIITVTRTSYRHFFAQTRDPSLFETLFIRPIAITAVLECPDGLVFGRRSSDVAFDSSLWELGPSGTIDDSAETSDGYLNWRTTVLEELQEEIGIRSLEDQTFGLFGVLEDAVLHSVDLITLVKTSLTRDQIEQAFLQRRNKEYTELAVVPRAELTAFARDHEGQMTPVCQDILGRISHS